MTFLNIYTKNVKRFFKEINFKIKLADCILLYKSNKIEYLVHTN
jgi:hypothetical protein